MSDDFPITVFHNPACATSRNTLAMIRAAGYEPMVVDYLKVGWDCALLDEILASIPTTPRELLRDKGTPAADLGLLERGVSGERILAAMIAHPILVNRPVVSTPMGVRLCRPSEVVLEILAKKPTGFVKEDGTVVA